MCVTSSCVDVCDEALIIPYIHLFNLHVRLVALSCPTLWDSLDCSLPGCSVHGIFQARILEWVAISYSRRSSWPRDQTHVPVSPALQADSLSTYPLAIFGEGNGNPLQYSCLESPVDGGAWWAAVHWVAQSQTWLKQLSMHACIGHI